MFVDNELLAVVYLILYLRKGEKQNVLISKLKGLVQKQRKILMHVVMNALLMTLLTKVFLH